MPTDLTIAEYCYFSKSTAPRRRRGAPILCLYFYPFYAILGDMDKPNQKPVWHDTLMAFARMSSWIGFPVIISLFLGKWLDQKFNTTPFIFIGLTCLAFIVSMIGLVREGMKYMKQVEKENGKHN